MAQRQRKPYQPGLNPAAYNRYGLASYTEAELQHEYSRIRREAKDRLRGFERSSTYRESPIYQEKRNAYPTLREIQGRAQLETLLIDAYRFVSSKMSSVSGVREADRLRVESLQARGYDFVNKGNIKEFGEFMDYLRDKKGMLKPASGDALEIFSEAKEAGVPIDKVARAFATYQKAYNRGEDITVTYQAQNARNQRRRERRRRGK